MFLRKTIRIYHECEGRIEKSLPRIAVWHHQARQMMTNGDHEGRIFLSHPITNNGFFFLPTTKYHILCLKTIIRLPENPKFTEMQLGDIILA